MSLLYREVYVEAQHRNKMLRADDPRLDHNLSLNHEDGSFFFWRNAFVEKLEDWVMVFTEHHGFYVYGKDEVSYRQVPDVRGVK